MKYLISAILFSISISNFAQIGVKDEDWDKVKTQDFEQLLIDLNIDCSIPKDFSEVELIENDKVLYNKAYKHNSSNFEIRIWVRDLRPQNTPEGLTADQFSKSFLTMLSMNASGAILPNIPKISVFDKSTSTKEFNADWTASTAFLLTENNFNTGFKVGSIIGMRKNAIAEVYVFFMISNRTTGGELLKNNVQVVKFNNEL